MHVSVPVPVRARVRARVSASVDARRSVGLRFWSIHAVPTEPQSSAISAARRFRSFAALHVRTVAVAHAPPLALEVAWYAQVAHFSVLMPKGPRTVLRVAVLVGRTHADSYLTHPSLVIPPSLTPHFPSRHHARTHAHTACAWAHTAVLARRSVRLC